MAFFKNFSRQFKNKWQGLVLIPKKDDRKKLVWINLIDQIPPYTEKCFKKFYPLVQPEKSLQTNLDDTEKLSRPYVMGSNPKIDEAISPIERVRNFLRQATFEAYSYENTPNLLKEIVGR